MNRAKSHRRWAFETKHSSYVEENQQTRGDFLDYGILYIYFLKSGCKNIRRFENFTLLATIRRGPRRFQA
jgi:hypothetical protein